MTIQSEPAGFTYFKKRRYWRYVTREERYFCSEFHFLLRQDPNRFINWLNGKLTNKLTNDHLLSDWEVGYEVCFYRDYSRMVSVLPPGFSPKRTFDLCLFSESAIIVIEAKAQQGFGAKQLYEISRDRESLERIVGPDVEIRLIGLIASAYGPRPNSRKHFDAIISWLELAGLYNSEALRLADGLFRR